MGVNPFNDYSGSHDNLKPEREEGELSPNGDFEEENFGAFQVEASNGASKLKEGSASRPLQGRRKEVVKLTGENHADADDEGDESAQRSTEDSENASEADEDASGSESGGGEEFSREDHEEEEDDMDPDTKAQSEGEAEITEAQDLDVGISLPFSERLHSTVKPLYKYVTDTLQNHEDKVTNIFYGNDSFYVLLRLHQVSFFNILQGLLYGPMWSSWLTCIDCRSYMREYCQLSKTLPHQKRSGRLQKMQILQINIQSNNLNSQSSLHGNITCCIRLMYC